MDAAVPLGAFFRGAVVPKLRASDLLLFWDLPLGFLTVEQKGWTPMLVIWNVSTSIHVPLERPALPEVCVVALDSAGISSYCV
jgi:hypothetical protein